MLVFSHGWTSQSKNTQIGDQVSCSLEIDPRDECEYSFISIFSVARDGLNCHGSDSTTSMSGIKQ